MSYQVLARKYRPQHFAEVIGQEHVTRTLKNAIEQGRVAHGYIFSGHRGIGKTTIARILAMALNCRSSDKPSADPCGKCESCVEIRAGNALDVIEIDAATNRGIDEIRELRDASRYRPARDRYKIYILDEAHQITDAAFNALLKTLEEPPGHVIFMLATTQAEDIPQTIRSRCQQFNFHAVRFEDIVGQLKTIALQENIAADDDALAVLAEVGDGSMRDALSIMDQAIACCDGRLTAAAIRNLVGAVPSEVLERMLHGVHSDSSSEVLRHVDELLNQGYNPAHFARQMVRFLRNALVAKVAGADSSLLQISADERNRVAGIAANFSEEDLTRFLNIMLRTFDELAYKHEQRFHLELGLLRMVHAQRMLPLEQLLSTAGGSTGSATKVSQRNPSPQSPSFQSAAIEKSLPSTRKAELAETISTTAQETRSSAAKPNHKESGTLASGPGVAGKSLPPDRFFNGSTEDAPVSSEAFAMLSPSTTTEISPSPEIAASSLREAVVAALEKAQQGMIANLLNSGRYIFEGNQLTIEVGVTAAIIGIAYGSEAKRIAEAAASHEAGRPIKIKVVAAAKNGTQQTPAAEGKPSPSSNDVKSRLETVSVGSAAAEEPVVRRMQEKFGAEVRSVIDHRKSRSQSQ